MKTNRNFFLALSMIMIMSSVGIVAIEPASAGCIIDPMTGECLSVSFIAKIKGYVKDSTSGLPIKNALVQMKIGSSQVTYDYTDSNGYYYVSHYVDGTTTFTLAYSHQDYHNTVATKTVSSDTVVTVNKNLARDSSIVESSRLYELYYHNTDPAGKTSEDWCDGKIHTTEVRTETASEVIYGDPTYSLYTVNFVDVKVSMQGKYCRDVNGGQALYIAPKSTLINVYIRYQDQVLGSDPSVIDPIVRGNEVKFQANNWNFPTVITWNPSLSVGIPGLGSGTMSVGFDLSGGDVNDIELHTIVNDPVPGKGYHIGRLKANWDNDAITTTLSGAFAYDIIENGASDTWGKNFEIVVEVIDEWSFWKNGYYYSTERYEITRTPIRLGDNAYLPGYASGQDAIIDLVPGTISDNPV